MSLTKSVKFMSSGKLVGSTVTARGLAVNQSQCGEKIVLYIVCFAHSLLSLVFPLLSY